MKKQLTKSIIGCAVMCVLSVVTILGTNALAAGHEGSEYSRPSKEQIAAAKAEAEAEAKLNQAISDAIAKANGSYKAGTYEAEAKGFEYEYSTVGGMIKVTVTVSDKAITDIVISGPDQSPAIGGVAMTKLRNSILTSQSADVDTVTGATYTSEAVIEATKKALEQAK